MKYLLLLLGLVSANQAAGQRISLRGRIRDSESNKGFWGATILFKQVDEVVMGSITDSTGAFSTSIKQGIYDVDIQTPGFRTKTTSNIVVSSESLLLLLDFPGPCQFVYSIEALPCCPAGHADHIIPIVYGLPGKKLLKRAKEGKIYLGGCGITGCDPKYYCPIHHKEF